MIFAYLKAAQRFIARLPAWARWLAIALVALVAFKVWLGFHDRAVIRNYEAGVQAKIAAQTEKRNEHAAGVLGSLTAETNERITNAEKAADGADDPLAATFDSLRGDRKASPAAR